MTKEQLISGFEDWYTNEFEVPAMGMDEAYNASLQKETAAQPTESIFGGSHHEDDD